MKVRGFLYYKLSSASHRMYRGILKPYLAFIPTLKVRGFGEAVIKIKIESKKGLQPIEELNLKLASKRVKINPLNYTNFKPEITHSEQPKQAYFDHSIFSGADESSYFEPFMGEKEFTQFEPISDQFLLQFLSLFTSLMEAYQIEEEEK